MYIINSSLVLVYIIYKCVGQMYMCMHNIVFSYILMCGYVHMLIVWSPNAFPEKIMYLGRGLHMSFYYHCTIKTVHLLAIPTIPFTHDVCPELKDIEDRFCVNVRIFCVHITS